MPFGSIGGNQPSVRILYTAPMNPPPEAANQVRNSWQSLNTTRLMSPVPSLPSHMVHWPECRVHHSSPMACGQACPRAPLHWRSQSGRRAPSSGPPSAVSSRSNGGWQLLLPRRIQYNETRSQHRRLDLGYLQEIPPAPIAAGTRPDPTGAVPYGPAISRAPHLAWCCSLSVAPHADTPTQTHWRA
jgi:hypothetical protein